MLDLALMAVSQLGRTLTMLFILLSLGVVVNILVVVAAVGIIGERRANQARKQARGRG